MEEREPVWLIEKGYLEKLEDFEHNGKPVLASRLGYRMTERFVHGFIGKIFDNPDAVFTDEILKPEIQDLDVYVDGINNIVEAQQRVALQYLEDGSIEDACPPLQALLLVMATGKYAGMDAHHPEFRAMFTLDNLLASDWYKERLEIKQQRDIALWQRHTASLQQFLDDQIFADEAERLGIRDRLQRARHMLEVVESPEYLHQLIGTLGADPLGPPRVMKEQRIVEWGRARLAPDFSSNIKQDPQAVAVYHSPSLLERFASRFKRAPIN